ncbi:MAG: type II toxin-antitoxin system HicB family antitoxin [Lachnospiraceae bacterium]|nr:type II toxin-antitoxin system HicB family antitoxin [Lachnospiraceae bacterium]
MAKYVYPAVFTPDEDGFSITFPDIDGCYTQGDDLADGIKMAEDALALMLTYYEDERKEIPVPTPINDLSLENDAFTSYISCDTTVYRRLMNNTAVKKTLSIPSWLNDSATAAGINFSQVLQEALIQKVGAR